MSNIEEQHIPKYNNKNQAIVKENNSRVPLCYFNRLLLKAGEKHSYKLQKHESVAVLSYGSCNIKVDEEIFVNVGNRDSLWNGKTDSVYCPIDSEIVIKALSDCEVFVAGGIYEKKLKAFRVKPDEVQKIQYGSDDTKTHRKILHILGKNAEGRVGRLLVSELFTVGKGGWSGFPPHKHDTDRMPLENRFEEVYHFRFLPEKGFGAQFLNPTEQDQGPVYHLKNEATISIDRGYHPCVVAPGYQMYYFTILVGQKDSRLTQYFHPDHKEQIETIPGLKDMIAGFK